MASPEKLTQLTAATLPLDDTDYFYVVQQTTSTTSTSHYITFLDLTNEVIRRGGITVP